MFTSGISSSDTTFLILYLALNLVFAVVFLFFIMRELSNCRRALRKKECSETSDSMHISE